MRTIWSLLGIAAAAALVAGGIVVGCSANGSNGNPGSVGGGGSAGSTTDAGPDGTMFGCNSCMGNSVQLCDDQGNPTGSQDCAPKICAPTLGCRDCLPGQPTCVGNEVHECTTDGTPGALVQACDATQGEACVNGKCGSECDVLAGSSSYVGCAQQRPWERRCSSTGHLCRARAIR